jgi:SsrA-binding protein
MAQSKHKSNGAKNSARSNGAKGDGYDLVVENRKARHDFFIEESLEAGLALTGTEVKSLRAHKANLRDSYARIKDGEAFLQGVHIGAYAPAGQFSHKETRARKLLMHRREIDRLWGRVRERGYSIVPLKIYFRDGRAKVEIALAKGKHLYDKRESIARKSSKRDIERALKSRNR